MSAQISIPVIDFSVYRLGRNIQNDEELLPLAKEVYDAFRNVGFCYLKNHGIPQEKIDDVYNVSKRFFQLDKATKLKYNKFVAPDAIHGYTENERECLNADRIYGDKKETYNVNFATATSWPEEVPEFKSTLTDFTNTARELALRVLDTISLSFNKKDINFVRNCHKALNTPESDQCHCILRTAYYPAAEISDFKGNQIRCGEHSDYGSMTLLFQDDVGGLEIQTKNGDYIPATPIPGTVVVNLGDLMQMWTADTLIAAKHRVVNKFAAKERQSIAFFCGTDMDLVLECLDGSNKYEPITAREYLFRQFKKTHAY